MLWRRASRDSSARRVSSSTKHFYHLSAHCSGLTAVLFRFTLTALINPVFSCLKLLNLAQHLHSDTVELLAARVLNVYLGGHTKNISFKDIRIILHQVDVSKLIANTFVVTTLQDDDKMPMLCLQLVLLPPSHRGKIHSAFNRMFFDTVT